MQTLQEISPDEHLRTGEQGKDCLHLPLSIYSSTVSSKVRGRGRDRDDVGVKIVLQGRGMQIPMASLGRLSPRPYQSGSGQIGRIVLRIIGLVLPPWTRIRKVIQLCLISIVMIYDPIP